MAVKIKFLKNHHFDKNILKTQLPKIELDGYHSPVFCNSRYSDGGVAIYVSEDLIIILVTRVKVAEVII